MFRGKQKPMIIKKHVPLVLKSVLISIGLGVWIGTSACSNRPQAERFSGTSVLPPVSLKIGDPRTLWIALTDYSANGQLARLDLASGNLSYGVLTLAPDVHLVPDGDGLFLLQRNSGDSITRVGGLEAKVEATYALPSTINPQSATRDRAGRVWVVSLDSNVVTVLSPDLRQEVHKIDLQALVRGTADPWAELYDLVALADGRMLVVAARVDRPNWVPNANAGAAYIDSESFALLRIVDLPVANVTQAFLVDGGSTALVVGSGAQDPGVAMNGGFTRLSDGLQIAENTTLGTRPIHSSMDREGNLAWIAWDPASRRSCIRYGNVTLTCEAESAAGSGAGLFFYRIAVGGGKIFVSYQRERNNELWVIDLQTRMLNKIRLPMAVGALALSP